MLNSKAFVNTAANWTGVDFTLFHQRELPLVRVGKGQFAKTDVNCFMVLLFFLFFLVLAQKDCMLVTC